MVKDSDFDLITELVKPDSKKRVALSAAILGSLDGFRVYRNKLGQIVLDPVKTIPAHEAWLFDNPEALASVKKGLQESAEGKLKDLGSFAQFAEEG